VIWCGPPTFMPAGHERWRPQALASGPKTTSTVWATESAGFERGGSFCRQASATPPSIDGVVAFAWIERLLPEAKVLIGKQLLAAAGACLDTRAKD